MYFNGNHYNFCDCFYWASVVVFYNRDVHEGCIFLIKKGGGNKNFNLVQYYSTLK